MKKKKLNELLVALCCALNAGTTNDEIYELMEVN